MSLIKFFIGVLLLQGTTALLVYTALKTDLAETWLLFGGLGIAVGAFTALWFQALSENLRKHCLAKAQVNFSRERERIRVRAEREKSKEYKNAQQRIQRLKQRSQTGSQIKTGILIGGAVSAGLVLLMTQMVTLGLLALTTVGGVALGYGVRVRQERLGLGGAREARDSNLIPPAAWEEGGQPLKTLSGPDQPRASEAQRHPGRRSDSSDPEGDGGYETSG